MRSTVLARRVEIAPTKVATAVSKNTGAKANWILLVRASMVMFIGAFGVSRLR
jgi:hypothetical protein